MRLLVKGAALFLTLIISIFLVFSLLEYIGHFGSSVRLTFLIVFALIFTLFLAQLVVIPFTKFINNKKALSNELAASEIGKRLPNISDKLLNTLQLLNINTDNDLLHASINQRSTAFENIDFSSTINYDEIKKRYLLLLLIPFSILTISLITIPDIITDSTKRIVNYSEKYVEPAPFQFQLLSKEKAYYYENYTILLSLEGDTTSDMCTIVVNDIEHIMELNSSRQFTYKIDRVNEDLSFHFQSSGYESKQFTIETIKRPIFQSFEATVNYPLYTGLKPITLNSIGTLSLPKGSIINWSISVKNAESVRIKSKDKELIFNKLNNIYSYTKKILNTEKHELFASNEEAVSKNKYEYTLTVIEDEFPSISVQPYQDSTLYTYLFVNGKINDDYGFSALKFFYRKTSRLQSNLSYKSLAIPFSRNTSNQTFNFEVNLDSINLQEGENIEYYLAVYDNDLINGSKETRSTKLSFELPSKQEIDSEIDNASAKNSEALEDALQEAQSLKKKVDELSKNIKTKKELDWQDKKEVEKILNKHQQLEEKLKNVQEQMVQNFAKEERFNEMDENVKKKSQELQSLINEVMDDEMQKMMEDLNKLMNENLEKEDLDKILEKINEKDENIENELDRTIEMYKNLKFEKDFQKTMNNLEELAQQQNDLSKLSEDKNMDSEILQKEQEHLNREFEEMQKQLDNLQNEAKDLDRNEDFEQLKDAAKTIDEEMKQSSESLSKGKNKKAAESQKKAGDKIQEMAQQMQDMQQTEQMQAAEENLDDLRDILENLITLSYNQEELMTNFRGIRLRDPRFVELSQQQLKLLDDSEMIEDSLLSLAKRVFQIESFVTREVTAMKNQMSKATEKLKQRKPNQATSHQQYAMTAMNNLALLLSDVMQQMQQQMAQQMQGDQMCNKPGKNKKPGLGQMQKQLNQMMKQLKDGQKSGRELSKQLGQMAGQQQRIRQALKEMEGQQGSKEGENGEEGSKLGDQLKKLSELMEETEKDLLYKKYNSKTYERNQEILTRLLEAEKAAKERDLDNKREAQHSTQKTRNNPPQLEEYLKQKQKQIELLRSIPPGLKPYYKKEVDEYFNTIEN